MTKYGRQKCFRDEFVGTPRKTKVKKKRAVTPVSRLPTPLPHRWRANFAHIVVLTFCCCLKLLCKTNTDVYVLFKHYFPPNKHAVNFFYYRSSGAIFWLRSVVWHTRDQSHFPFVSVFCTLQIAVMFKTTISVITQQTIKIFLILVKRKPLTS